MEQKCEKRHVYFVGGGLSSLEGAVYFIRDCGFPGKNIHILEGLDVMSMDFTDEERISLTKLLITPEEKLDNLRICDWFAKTPHFFETNFWYMWQTPFAFQKWSSIFKFKRYMQRMILEFSRIQT